MLRRHVLVAAILAGSLTAPLAATPAFAQQALAAPSSAWVNAVIQGLNSATRTEVERRSTAGNHPYEVLRIMLLNNMQLANLIQPGQPPLTEVVAIDFIRETAVVRQGDGLRAVGFDRSTLEVRR
jgi:hypothetical protein